jgi:hypothetical protein
MITRAEQTVRSEGHLFRSLPGNLNARQREVSLQDLKVSHHDIASGKRRQKHPRDGRKQPAPPHHAASSGYGAP